MRAVILAGGKGTRLRPYTVTIPKPLVPVGDDPIVGIVIKQLKKEGFTHITMAVNYMADMIMAFFGNGDKWGIKIDYSIENKPLSTIGPLTLIEDLPEHFLVMNGDVLTDLPYKKLMEYHIENKNDVTVATYKRRHKVDFGVLRFDEKNLIYDFKEKPVYEFDVSMGVYVINKRIVESLKKNEPYGFDNLMIDGIRNGLKIRSYPYDGIWLDIGRPDDYERAVELYKGINDE